MATLLSRALTSSVLNQNILKIQTLNALVIQRNVAVKKADKKKSAVPVVKRNYLTPETDPNKLCTHLCGGNIMKEGSDPVLKPDSEYPDWLWELRTERGSVPFEELEPDSDEYWRRIHKDNVKANLNRQRLMYKFKRF